MNWVSSSLQLAGTLLESVDQHAAMTLAGACSRCLRCVCGSRGVLGA
jgi:hypothetical protein